jgi:serine/threonine protein kinase
MQGQLEIKRPGNRETFRWPTWLNTICAAGVILTIIALSVWTVRQSESTLEAYVASKLRTILKIECEAVRQWAKSKKQLASFLASDPKLAETLAIADFNSPQSQRSIDDYLIEVSKNFETETCLLLSANGEVIANSGDRWLATQMAALQNQLTETRLAKQPTISSVIYPTDAHADDVPFATVVIAPIHHPTQGIVGFFALGYNAQVELTTVLESSRAGETGETLALSNLGTLISLSRFDNALDGERAFPNFTSDLPIGNNSSTRAGFNRGLDQRDANVVWVSRWMPEMGVGILAKMDVSEANIPVMQIRRFMWGLCGLLLLATTSAFFYRWNVYRLGKLAKQSELNRKRLGPYELEEKIGEGGMGVVYRAHHALMRRPTAVKILPPEKSSPAAIERFEREVKYTSQLQHPNTISIYDYGRTANGLFYYAMELLEGLDLDQLIRREGPLPEGRVLSILRQVCESLREAHDLGLVHRDIKPANIMLCNRGGVVDMVKVLDFGIVQDRSRDTSKSNEMLAGTPAYMAPECFANPNSVDMRADTFAVGAVGFLLLTGTPLLEASNLPELLKQHQKDISSAAANRLQANTDESERQISPRLIQLIARCVAPDRKDRLASASDILTEISSCRPTIAWDNSAARAWWQKAEDSTSAPDNHLHDDDFDLTQPFTTTTKDDPRRNEA